MCESIFFYFTPPCQCALFHNPSLWPGQILSSEQPLPPHHSQLLHMLSSPSMPIITYPFNSFPRALATGMPTNLGAFSGYFSDIIHIFITAAAHISIFSQLRVIRITYRLWLAGWMGFVFLYASLIVGRLWAKWNWAYGRSRYAKKPKIYEHRARVKKIWGADAVAPVVIKMPTDGPLFPTTTSQQPVQLCFHHQFH